MTKKDERKGMGKKKTGVLIPAAQTLSAMPADYMGKFAEAWPDRKIVQRCAAQLPWRSNLALLDKLDDSMLRLWYAEKALDLGMSRDMLVEYALTGYNKPMGVAQWEREITQSLLEELKSSLPTVEEIEAELGGGCW